MLGSQLRFLNERGFEVLTASADGPEVQFLKDARINHVVVPMTRKITPLRDLQSLFRLLRIIHKFRPDIVHTHTPKAGLLGMLASWLLRIPVRLHTVAGLPIMESEGARKRILGFTEVLTYASATQVYPNSTGLLNYMVSHWPAYSKKFKIIGRGSTNGINTQVFARDEAILGNALHIRQKYHLKDTTFVFIGRIVKDKGIVELLDAFRLFTAHRPASLILVGDFEPDLDPIPNEYIDYINSSESIHAVGFQKDVKPWLAASDIFVFPSYREGFPNVVLQACSMQLPCIVTDIPGSREAVIDNYSGLIVPPKNATALAEAMKILAGDVAKRSVFAENARDFVVKNFEQQYLWNELLKEYNRVREIH